MSAWQNARLAGGAAVMRAMGLPRIARRRYDWYPLVVTYHGVHDGSLADDHARFSTKHVGVGDFRRQLEWLRRHYEIVPLSEIESILREGRWRRGVAAITFDDGYENNLTVAWPVLKALGLPATLFVTVEVVDRRRPYDHDRIELSLRYASARRIDLEAGGARRTFELCDDATRAAAVYAAKAWYASLPADKAARWLDQLMAQCWQDDFVDRCPVAYRPLTWPQVRRLSDEGFEIGSHTLSHPHLARVDDARLRRELTESRAVLEAKLGRPVLRVSYPYGSVDARTPRAAAEAGYASGYTTRTWWTTDPRDAYRVARISVGAGQPFGLFVVAMTRALQLVGLGGRSATTSS